MKSQIWFTCFAMLAAGCVPGWAASHRGFKLASSPASADAGQQVLFCAANVGRGPVEVTLELRNVKTGAVIVEKTVVLPSADSAQATPDPCLTISGSADPLVVTGVLTMRSKAFFKPAEVTASFQVLAPAPAGGMRTIQVVPLRPLDHPGGDVVYVPTP